MTAPDRNPAIDAAQGRPTTADARFVDQVCEQIVAGRRAARAMARWCKQYGLSEPEFQVLWRLRGVAGTGIDQATLAKGLVLSPAQVSATVERLRSRGWIAQQLLRHDRRRHAWQLSPAGQTLLEQILAEATELRIGHHNPHSGEVAA